MKLLSTVCLMSFLLYGCTGRQVEPARNAVNRTAITLDARCITWAEFKNDTLVFTIHDSSYLRIPFDEQFEINIDYNLREAHHGN